MGNAGESRMHCFLRELLLKSLHFNLQLLQLAVTTSGR
jgi:hypothetical protein